MPSFLPSVGSGGRGSSRTHRPGREPAPRGTPDGLMPAGEGSGAPGAPRGRPQPPPDPSQRPGCVSSPGTGRGRGWPQTVQRLRNKPLWRRTALFWLLGFLPGILGGSCENRHDPVLCAGSLVSSEDPRRSAWSPSSRPCSPGAVGHLGGQSKGIPKGWLWHGAPTAAGTPPLVSFSAQGRWEAPAGAGQAPGTGGVWPGSC